MTRQGKIFLTVMALALIAVLVIIAGKGKAQAQTVTQEAIQVTIDYDEPKVNENGSELNDLAFTKIFVDVLDGQDDLIETIRKSVDATSPKGGKHIQEVIKIDENPNVVAVKIWIYATDTAGNQSPKSKVITKAIIRPDTTAPGVAKNLKGKTKIITIVK